MTLLAPHAALNALLIDEKVREALNEDLGRAGDITGFYCVSEEARGRVALNARQAGVIVGLPFAESAFRLIDPNTRFSPHLRDGDSVKAGDTLAIIAGNARSMLAAERVALNFLGHLSGIATLTSRFAAKIAHTKAKITCTRKTTPLLRAFEKYAVKAGGGSSHRYGLDDAILIKDNHIALAGGITAVLKRAKENAGHLVRIEIEVDTLKQFEEVLRCNVADVVLLDNMPPEMLREAIRLNQSQVILEASGGITLESVAAVAETGVDYISSGALTHSVKTLDIGLDTL
jgi:nicotinate-nucleotide pyrophosphorylase (carboxylating)